MSPAAMGLTLNMVGVGLAFFVGFPQPSHEEGVALGLEPATPLPSGETVAQRDSRVRRRKRLYVGLSHLALGLMLFGFLLQLADLLIKGQ
jgi:hypothetical protein